MCFYALKIRGLGQSRLRSSSLACARHNIAIVVSSTMHVFGILDVAGSNPARSNTVNEIDYDKHTRILDVLLGEKTNFKVFIFKEFFCLAR